MWLFKKLTPEAIKILELCYCNKERIAQVGERHYILTIGNIHIRAYRGTEPMISLNDWNCGLPSRDQKIIYKRIRKYAIDNHARDLKIIRLEQQEATRRLISKCK